MQRANQPRPRRSDILGASDFSRCRWPFQASIIFLLLTGRNIYLWTSEVCVDRQSENSAEQGEACVEQSEACDGQGEVRAEQIETSDGQDEVRAEQGETCNERGEIRVEQNDDLQVGTPFTVVTPLSVVLTF